MRQWGLGERRHRNILIPTYYSVKIESMNNEQTHALVQRAAAHAALADVHRLRIVDLLAASDASSSEVATALTIPSNLLAHHLKVLEEAGLVTRRRSEGDGRRTYLSLNRHELRLLVRAPSPVTLVPARRLVFVCTANAARSHLAAALWREASSIEATSAGTHPADRINPGAIAAARRHHLDLPVVAPRLLADIRADGDLVVTVCDRAHEELGDVASVHWSIPDPVPDGTRDAFDAAHDALAERVGSLAGAAGLAARGG